MYVKCIKSDFDFHCRLSISKIYKVNRKFKTKCDINLSHDDVMIIANELGYTNNYWYQITNDSGQIDVFSEYYFEEITRQQKIERVLNETGNKK